MNTKMKTRNPIFMAFFCTALLTGICFSKDASNNSDTGRLIQSPLVYRDSISGVIFVVETDGRHVDAISAKGKLLWSKDPLIEGFLGQYRLQNPQINYIGPPSPAWRELGARGRRDRFIGIGFNNTQFGGMNIETGDFLFFGQD